MRSVFYKCDGLECNEKTENMYRSKWTLVDRMNPDSDEGQFHFCTIKCMLQFFNVQDSWRID